MNVEDIREIIETPHVLRTILGTYDGAYSVGVGHSREHEGRYVILLRVEDEEPEGFPEEVTVNGHHIPVVVRGGFEAPKPSSTRKNAQRMRAQKTTRRGSERRRNAA